MQNEELRRSQVELENARRKYFELYAFSPAACVTLSGEGRMREVNDHACRLLGVDRDRLLGQPFSAFLDPESTETLAMLRRDAGDGKGLASGELGLARADGTKFHVQAEIAAAPAPEGEEPSGHWLSLCDITLLKNLQKEKDKAIRELSRSNKELEDFAYVASHDLREPLRKIHKFGDLFFSRYGEGLDERGVDYLRRMQAASVRMQDMIDALLAYSRIATVPGRLEEVDLAEAAREALANLEVEMEKRGAVVSLGNLPVLTARRHQMIQLFQNLVHNAIKFSRPGVAPVVKIHSELLRRSGTGRDEVRCALFVEDSGIGFDPRHAERAFVPFERLVGRSEYDGVGIGLAICKKIAEGHGGMIRAQSEPGRGSTFIVTLPVRPCER